MMKWVQAIVIMGMLVATTSVNSGMLPFKKHRLLMRGMSAGEVLYRVGPPDFRQLRDIYWTNKQTWYYIPTPEDRDPWQTIIQFDARGYIQRIDRQKFLRDGH